MDLKTIIRDIPNFPKEGIVFRDIGPLLEDKRAFKYVIDRFMKKYQDCRIDKVVGVDARGFVLAGALANCLGAGMVMVRKKGKLPFRFGGRW